MPWGSISGAAVSVLTCGKVVGKSSGLDRDCGLQDNKAEGKEKKNINSGCGKTFILLAFWHLDALQMFIKGRPTHRNHICGYYERQIKDHRAT